MAAINIHMRCLNTVKFIEVPLLVFIRMETSGIEVFAPKRSGPCTVYLCVSCRRVLCRDL